jgi:hypothetical protein
MGGVPWGTSDDPRRLSIDDRVMVLVASGKPVLTGES